MKQLSKEIHQAKVRPIKAIQFGEGNFLRAFVDYMIDIANEKNILDMGVAVVKPIPMGNVEAFAAQDNLYTVCLQGMQDGEQVDSHYVVSSIQKVVDPFANYHEYKELATLESLEFVFSNTTEAGIVFDTTDQFDLTPANTFPGKLTQLLHQRFTHFAGDSSKGLIIIPCELIEANGDNLKDCVLKYASLWNLGEEFASWVLNHNVFCNTLVDRIVTGYPKEKAEEIFSRLGYQDSLLVAAEPFGLWVIESEKDISGRFPLDKAGLPVLFTENQKPYKDRKVRILNGGHTTMVLGAYLAGEDIVRSCMQNPIIRKFLERTLKDEIIPTLTLPKAELEEFSASVIERFENPFIDHSLLAISLNSVSKWKARVLPSFKDNYTKNGVAPKLIAFSLASIIAFYNGSEMKDGKLIGNRNGESYNIIDDADVLTFFAENSGLDASTLAEKVLSNTAFWGEDLTAYDNLTTMVTENLTEIRTLGALQAMKNIVGKSE